MGSGKMILLKNLIRGKVYTDKDLPAFKNINERTVRLSPKKDANFEPGQFVQILGLKGKVKLDKKSVHKLARIVRNLHGKHGMGWSFTGEGKIKEGLYMGPAKNAKVDVVHVRHKTSEKEWLSLRVH